MKPEILASLAYTTALNKAYIFSPGITDHEANNKFSFGCIVDLLAPREIQKRDAFECTESKLDDAIRQMLETSTIKALILQIHQK
jgi:hypothetical protein